MSDTSTASRPPPSERPPGGLGGTRRLFHVRGVPVRADASLVLAIGLFTFLYYGQYDQILRDLGTTAVAATAVVSALLLILSVLAHELGHTLVSLQRGIPVRSITLFALGGVTESTREAERARDEFAIVGVGPFVSLVLAAGFGLLHAAVATTRVPGAVTGYLAWTNLLLAVFNLVPGYPLDGGRLLRSVLWAVFGRPHRATRWAARVGQVFAAALIVLSVAPLLGAPGFGSLFNVFIGFFLFRGASQAHRQAQLRERLGTRTARDLMGSVPPPLDATLSVAAAVEQVQSRPSLLWPVGDPLAGAVTLSQLDRVPGEAWSRTTVGEVAFERDAVTVPADATMDDVLQRLASAPGTMLVVVDDGRAVGLVTPSLVTGVGG